MWGETAYISWGVMDAEFMVDDESDISEELDDWDEYWDDPDAAFVMYDPVSSLLKSLVWCVWLLWMW